MTTDWRSFVVYGICVGCGFAMTENLMYTLVSGYETAIARAFSAVPFHCTTGCILGIWVAKRRHFGQNVPWYKGELCSYVM
jgi:RsiW-degrading membrane proteinase PrsW (M82 family)